MIDSTSSSSLSAWDEGCFASPLHGMKTRGRTDVRMKGELVVGVTRPSVTHYPGLVFSSIRLLLLLPRVGCLPGERRLRVSLLMDGGNRSAAVGATAGVACKNAAPAGRPIENAYSPKNQSHDAAGFPSRDNTSFSRALFPMGGTTTSECRR